MNDKQLELYEREVEALEKQAEAVEKIASCLYIPSVDLKRGIMTIGEAFAIAVNAFADNAEKQEFFDEN